MTIFDTLESDVKGYCRDYPVIFSQAKGSEIITEDKTRYIDFLAGAGTLNYGHNHPLLKQAVIEHLQQDYILHGLDMHTKTKEQFLTTFNERILKPRKMNYKVQFPGPTGTNAVEAAMKLARKITGRENIVSFTNGFHGMSLGSLAATGNSHHRGGAGTSLNGTTFMPYDEYYGKQINTADQIRQLLEDPSSGLDMPAAMILETVQGEGGVNVASKEWLQDIQKICRDFDILLIIDDIQVGCGRTGTFFSFENMGISPDIITLSKSLGGIGLPMALVLMKPDLDQWAPGEHNGTFRGNNLAFTAAEAAIENFWCDETFSKDIEHKSALLRQHFQWIKSDNPDFVSAVRGRGMIYALEFKDPEIANLVVAESFKRRLLIENCGPTGNVIKFLGPLTTPAKQLEEGLKRLSEAVSEVCTSVAAELVMAK